MCWFVLGADGSELESNRLQTQTCHRPLVPPSPAGPARVPRVLCKGHWVLFCVMTDSPSQPSPAMGTHVWNGAEELVAYMGISRCHGRGVAFQGFPPILSKVNWLLGDSDMLLVFPLVAFSMQDGSDII